MNIYIYDSYLGEKKFQSQLSKIETRITDLGLNGKIFRLSLLKNSIDSIENEIKRGAKTLVAVGNNSTFIKVINALYTSSFPNALSIPVFIIPVGKENNSIADSLGIPNFQKACEILSSRRIMDLDLIGINNSYFIGQALVNTMGTKVQIDGDFTVEINEPGEIIFNNLNLENYILANQQNTRPDDSNIEVFVKTKREKEIKTIFNFKHAYVESKSPIQLDNSTEVNTPAEVSIGEKKIKLIVGKDRIF